MPGYRRSRFTGASRVSGSPTAPGLLVTQPGRVDLDLHAGHAERREVRGGEGLEAGRAGLHGAGAAQDRGAEHEAHLAHVVARGDEHGGEQVLAAVAAQHAERDLVPVTTTGLPSPRSRKASADAV